MMTELGLVTTIEETMESAYSDMFSLITSSFIENWLKF